MHEFREIAKDVYAFLQPPLICYSNAGVIVGERDVIVVDSLTNAAMTESLLTEIRRVTSKPIRFLINAHSHVDHVYTNHLFPDATVIATNPGREETKANLQAQAKHDAMFAEVFPDVDFRGGRYTLQTMCFSGSLFFHQGEREIRVLELGPGHSESDVVVHLPTEKILYCGDLFMNEMAPVPGEGRVSRTIAICKTIEALEANIYVAGHGAPGSLADVRAQRVQLEAQFQHARECYEKGVSYDAALQAHRAGSGAAILAVQRGAPLLPLGIYVPENFVKSMQGNFFNRKTLGSWQTRGRLFVTIGQPWLPQATEIADRGYKSLREITNRMMDQVNQLCSRRSKWRS